MHMPSSSLVLNHYFVYVSSMFIPIIFLQICLYFLLNQKTLFCSRKYLQDMNGIQGSSLRSYASLAIVGSSSSSLFEEQRT